MREFIYYSETTDRLDIAARTIVSAFFLSYKVRTDVKLHIFFGDKHLEFKPVFDGAEKIYLDKNNVKEVLQKMLEAYKEERTEVFPGYWIERKSFQEVVEGLRNEKQLILMYQEGEDIRKTNIENAVFVLGDQKGLPEIKGKKASVGPEEYFTSQVVTLIHNELDRKS